ncbi:MAG: hypothetical protein AAGJ50_04950 [Pseudomonadota bacterium]
MKTRPEAEAKPNNTRTSANVKALGEALEELKTEGILFSIDSDKRFDGRRLSDVHYSVYATSEFTTEVKAASARLNDSQRQLGLTR